MDSSRNNIDLFYLSRLKHYPMNNTQENSTDDTLIKDIKFYRKRILQTTKDLLRNNQISEDVDESFLDFARVLINYFKFKDKSEIIQATYDKLNEKLMTPPRKKEDIKKEMDKASKKIKEQTKKVMIKDSMAPSTNLKNFVTVKTKRKNTMIVPKKKAIDLKNEKFRSKNVE